MVSIFNRISFIETLEETICYKTASTSLFWTLAKLITAIASIINRRRNIKTLARYLHLFHVPLLNAKSIFYHNDITLNLTFSIQSQNIYLARETSTSTDR